MARPTGQSARRGGEVDLNDSPEQAHYRETVRAWLDEHRAEAPGHRAAATRTSAYIAARRAWQGKLAEGGLAGVTWPKEYGGQGLGPIEQVIVNQEIAARRRARDPRRDRRRHARPDDHRPRHRGAEGALPRPDAARRRGLVPALLRARRRLGPRRRSRRARAGRTTARWRLSGPEGVDDERAVRRPSACCSRAPTPTCPSTRA